jgi:hypothetical protein
MFVSCDSCLAQEPAVLISARARHLHMQAPQDPHGHNLSSYDTYVGPRFTAQALTLSNSPHACASKSDLEFFEILLPATPF